MENGVDSTKTKNIANNLSHVDRIIFKLQHVNSQRQNALQLQTIIMVYLRLAVFSFCHFVS